MIKLDHLTVRYGDFRALDDVTLHIGPGEFVLLTGASGCGKSTLARCLNGLIPHTIPAALSGSLTVAGLSPAESTVAEMATHVGMVFQNPATQLFNLVVEEEVFCGPRNLGLDEAEVTHRANRAMAATGIEALRHRRVQSLSGGEQQLVAITAALAMGSRLLVLDEPTANLDVGGTLAVMSALERLHQDGVTILVIEHRLGAVTRLAGRTVIMDQGRIVVDGPTDEVFGQPELIRSLGLRRPAREAQDDWSQLLTPNGLPGGPVIVEVKALDAGYGRSLVLRGLDLTVHAGDFVALVGDNGSGKTTLARVLAGVLKPRGGDVRLYGGRRVAPGRDVGLLFQNPLHQLFCETVGEDVSFGPRNFGCLDPDALHALLQATDLLSLQERPVHGLSSGQQQRTVLAGVLALGPRLIILDEPTLGQDWRHLCAFMDFLVELNRGGCTILLVTHDFRLVHRYARRILLLRDGHIVADGAPAGRLHAGE